MKIVDRKTFLSLPAGTLFSKYEPCVLDDLCIKGESRLPSGDNDPGDFWEQQIAGAIDAVNSGDYSEKLFESQEHGTSIKFDFYCEGRDGLYDAAQLFAVWEPDDVRQLISRLQATLKD
jgi:hypothetical protein